jgi:hypothetical protein
MNNSSIPAKDFERNFFFFFAWMSVIIVDHNVPQKNQNRVSKLDGKTKNMIYSSIKRKILYMDNLANIQ